MNNENARSAAHTSAAGVHIAPGWPGIEYGDIEHLHAVEPDDTVSRMARARAEARMSERAQALELACDLEPKASPRVPRDTEPCNLVAFCGIVAGGAAAAVCAAALLGWSVHAALKLAGVL